MLGRAADRTGATRARSTGQGRGARDGAGAGSAAGGDGGRGGPLDAGADPDAAEPAAGLRAAGRSVTGGPAGCCPGSRSTGPGSEPRGAGMPSCCAPRGAGLPADSGMRGPGMLACSAPRGAGMPANSGPGGRATGDGREPKLAGTRTGAGLGVGGHVRPRGVERPSGADRAPGHRRAGRQRVDRHGLEPLAHAVQHALRTPFTTTASASRSPSGSGTVRSRCRAPSSAPRTTSQVPGAPRARRPGMQQRQGGTDDLGVLRADEFQLRGPGGRSRRVGGPGIEHHAAVDVDQGCGDDPHVTQQWSEHDGDAVGPDVHHVPVASHEPPRSPLQQPAVDQR